MSPEAPRLCLIEDDPIMGESLAVRFELEGFAVDWHRTGTEALRALKSRAYSAVISDIRLPDLPGDAVFERARSQAADPPPFVFITGYGTIEAAVRLLKAGAADYITKPFEIEVLVEKLRRLARRPAAPAQAATLGISGTMRRIEAMLPQLARHANTLLITGESGVGKEHVAKAWDRLARGSEHCPFVAVNCGAIPEGLFESELFGHEKGAFTGAVRMRRGCFEQADHGTLFLDEIGEMPLAMQVKMLRAIQERRFTRLGGEAPVAVKLRLVCATNRDLKELVSAGRFREDLFYRIDVVNLRVPPLRSRPEDILWFARTFLDEWAGEQGEEPRRLDAGAERALMEYPWPGNVRELKHTIERACITAPALLLRAEDLFDRGCVPGPDRVAAASLEDYLRECERAYIQRALAESGRHMGNTAQALGISRKSLWEKMKRLGIQEAVPRQTPQ